METDRKGERGGNAIKKKMRKYIQKQKKQERENVSLAGPFFLFFFPPSFWVVVGGAGLRFRR